MIKTKIETNIDYGFGKVTKIFASWMCRKPGI